MIKLINISKSYKDNSVFKGMNLEFKKGSVTGIAGENGAGKTTLFKCITGFENFEGVIESEFNPLKNHIGFLQTNPPSMSFITGWEYLKLICLARNINEENFEENNIFELPLHNYVENYSTGMKKKLALMGVLLQGNEVIILDEPYNGVDVHSNMLITEIIHKLKGLNKIVLLSSHIFSTLSEVCDTIHLLKKNSDPKTYYPSHFETLESEMKVFGIGNKLEKFDIK